MKKFEKVDLSNCPKLSAGKLLKDNWFLIKTVFSASPSGVFLMFFEQFRVNALIFFEHTWLLQKVLECVEFKKPFKEALIPIVVITAILFVTSILGSIVGQWQRPKAQLKAETKLKNIIFEKAHETDLKNFDNPTYYNDFVMTAEKVQGLVDYVFDIIAVIGMTLGTLVTTGVYFATQNTVSFFLILFSAVFQLLLLIRNSKLLYTSYQEQKPFTRRCSYINRLFYFKDYAKELRLNGEIKDKAFEDYDKATDSLVGTLKKFNFHVTANGVLRTCVSMLLMDLALVLILVYQASVLGAISYSMVIILMNSAYSLRGKFSTLLYKIATSAENCMYVEKIHDFTAQKTEIVSEENLRLPEKPSSLELRNVSFGYNGEKSVINNVSMKLSPGEKIALVGSNGAGKTTLIKLIMRLYDPSEGEILLDGVNIKKYNVEAYRHHIGVVFQDFNLYATTIAENVVMSENGLDKTDKITSALTHSGFSNRLATLEKGIETPLTKEFEDEGTELSGGESQKIAIARAFFKNSGLIILDEPSSALDPIAEYNFNRYMADAAENSTVIFISHRLSTTRLADKIYVLENGAICEAGSHDELLEKGGRYSEMWHTQADKYQLD